MNLRDDDVVSAVALVMEDEAETSAAVEDAGAEPVDEPGRHDASPARPSSWSPTPRRNRTARSASIESDQGKEVVLSLSDRHFGTLEVSGR